MNLGRNICVEDLGNLSSLSIINFEAENFLFNFPVSYLRLSMPNSTIRHPNCDPALQTTAQKRLCEVETGEFDHLSVLRSEF